MLSDSEINRILNEHIHAKEIIEASDLMTALVPTADSATGSGTFKYVNRQWSLVTGWSKEKLTSTEFRHFIHPQDEAKSMEAYKRGDAFGIDYETGRLTGFPNRYLCADGRYVKLLWYGSTEAVKGLVMTHAIPQGYE